MLSNENLLNAQNAYINQLQAENTELKAKLRKAADDVLTADGLRVAAASNYNKVCEECEELKKTVAEMRSAAAQRSREDIEIRRLRAHNMQLRAEVERLRKTSGYTGVPMAIHFEDKTFQNNEDGLKAFAEAIELKANEEIKDGIERLSAQINTLNNANRRLEHHLRSAERALEEKDAELEAFRAHCGERSERNVDQAPRKLELTQCTPEQYEETLKCLHEMEDHITGFLDRMMKR